MTIVYEYIATTITYFERFTIHTNRMAVIIATMTASIVTILSIMVKCVKMCISRRQNKKKKMTDTDGGGDVVNTTMATTTTPTQDTNTDVVYFNPQMVQIAFIRGDDYRQGLYKQQPSEQQRRQTLQYNPKLKSLIDKLNVSDNAKQQPKVFQEIIDLLASRPNVESLIANSLNACPKLAVPLNTKGIPYNVLKKLIKPMDIIGVHTEGSTLTNVISFVQKRARQCEFWTHVSIVVTKDIIGADEMEDGELYVLEAVITGDIVPGYNADPVRDIYGNILNGTQIRSLKEQLEYSYKHSPKTTWWWGPLKPEVRKIVDECIRGDCCVNNNPKKTLFGFKKPTTPSPNTNNCPLRKCIVDVYGTPYPTSITKFIAGFAPFEMEPVGAKTQSNSWWFNGLNELLPQHMTGYAKQGHGGSLFCSELIVYAFAHANVLDKDTYKDHARRFYPVDFIPTDSTPKNSKHRMPHDLIESINSICAY